MNNLTGESNNYKKEGRRPVKENEDERAHGEVFFIYVLVGLEA